MKKKFYLPFGALVAFASLKINKVETRLFAYFIEQCAMNRSSISVSHTQLRNVACTKSKSQIEKAIKHLQSMSLIECTDKGNGRKAAKYKVIDERFIISVYE